jgi:ribonuclease J
MGADPVDRPGSPVSSSGGAGPVRVGFLGGLGDIGRNCAFVEHGGRIVVLDVGIMFPDPEMPGIDLVLPDLSYLVERRDAVDAVVLTHGHEDHVGGLAYLLREISVPVYGSALTLELARARVEEAGVAGNARFVEVSDGDRLAIGPFDVELIPVAHSVPYGFATAIHTPQGVVLHTGDFKLDAAPVDGRLTDLGRIAEIASSPGIRLLLSDSTNADEPGFTDPETNVGATFRRLFAERAGRRIVVTCFASHLHRLQQAAEAAIETGRRVATLGRSMRRNFELASRLGVIDLPAGAFVDIEEIGGMAPGEVCVLSTGSQGEPLSALAQLAAGENKRLKIVPGDVVILSSHPIPGNEWAIGKVMDGLVRRGAEVLHTGVEPVHVSGHACAGELLSLLSIAKPEFFVPVHGQYRHLDAHARLAYRAGVPQGNVFVCEDGDSVVLDEFGMHRGDPLPAEYLYVDGTVDGVEHSVLRDRKVLAEEGVVIVVATVDAHAREVVTKPEIVTRGWVHSVEEEELAEEASSAVLVALEDALAKGVADHETLTRAARRALGKLVGERTRRRPMIVPVIVTV